MCKNVGSLVRLWEEAKDVIDYKQSTLGRVRAGLVSLHSITRHHNQNLYSCTLAANVSHGDVAALVLVSLGHDRRHAAASVRLHGRFAAELTLEFKDGGWKSTMSWGHGGRI